MDELSALLAEGDHRGYFRALRAERPAGKRTRVDLVLPPPEHASRDPWPSGFPVPRVVEGIRKAAHRSGWTESRLTYSRGPVKSTGLTWRMTHVVALRVDHTTTGRALVITYECPVGAAMWAAKVVRVGGGDVPPIDLGGSGRVREYLQSAPGWSGSELIAWARS